MSNNDLNRPKTFSSFHKANPRFKNAQEVSLSKSRVTPLSTHVDKVRTYKPHRTNKLRRSLSSGMLLDKSILLKSNNKDVETKVEETHSKKHDFVKLTPQDPLLPPKTRTSRLATFRKANDFPSFSPPLNSNTPNDFLPFSPTQNSNITNDSPSFSPTQYSNSNSNSNSNETITKLESPNFLLDTNHENPFFNISEQIQIPEVAPQTCRVLSHSQKSKESRSPTKVRRSVSSDLSLTGNSDLYVLSLDMISDEEQKSKEVTNLRSTSKSAHSLDLNILKEDGDSKNAILPANLQKIEILSTSYEKVYELVNSYAKKALELAKISDELAGEFNLLFKDDEISPICTKYKLQQSKVMEECQNSLYEKFNKVPYPIVQKETYSQFQEWNKEVQNTKEKVNQTKLKFEAALDTELLGCQNSSGALPGGKHYLQLMDGFMSTSATYEEQYRKLLNNSSEFLTNQLNDVLRVFQKVASCQQAIALSQQKTFVVLSKDLQQLEDYSTRRKETTSQIFETAGSITARKRGTMDEGDASASPTARRKLGSPRLHSPRNLTVPSGETSVPEKNMKLTTMDVIEHPVYYSSFRRFTKKNLSEENLNFWEEAQAFSLMDDSSGPILKERAQEIYVKYIHQDADKLINIDHIVVAQISEIMEKGEITPQLYRVALKDIYQLMQMCEFPRYILTDDFREDSKLVGKFKNHPTAYKREPSKAILASLSTLIWHPVAVEYFKAHLKSTNNGRLLPCLELIKKIQLFNSETNSAKKKTRAMSIWRSYLNPPNINILPCMTSTVRQVQLHLPNPSKGMFDEVAALVKPAVVNRFQEFLVGPFAQSFVACWEQWRKESCDYLRQILSDMRRSEFSGIPRPWWEQNITFSASKRFLFDIAPEPPSVPVRMSKKLKNASKRTLKKVHTVDDTELPVLLRPRTSKPSTAQKLVEGFQDYLQDKGFCLYLKKFLVQERKQELLQFYLDAARYTTLKDCRLRRNLANTMWYFYFQEDAEFKLAMEDSIQQIIWEQLQGKSQHPMDDPKLFEAAQGQIFTLIAASLSKFVTSQFYKDFENEQAYGVKNKSEASTKAKLTKKKSWKSILF